MRQQHMTSGLEALRTLLMLYNHRGLTAASFGGVAGVFALFFFSDVPKVRKDIMQVRALPRISSVQPGANGTG